MLHAGVIARAFWVMALFISFKAVHAQAGPPFLTNDPGTPGDGNWEINIASMQTVARGIADYQVPLVDLNFGLGSRLQLTYEVPFVIQSSDRQTVQAGWGNGYPGIKWRFLDQGDDGWQMSIFPQMETSGTRRARDSGIAGPGPRFLLPFETARRFGPLDIDLEVGYYVAGHGPKERVLGLVIGRPVSDRFELDTEVYDDKPYAETSHLTTVDCGWRYKLRPGVVALFMAGRSINGFAKGQPEFMGYVGVQLLLSHHGLRLNSDP